MVRRCTVCGIWTDYGIVCSTCLPDPLDETYKNIGDEDQTDNLRPSDWEGEGGVDDG